MPAELKPIKPNWFGMQMAKALRAGRDLGNAPGKLPESVPLIGGMGAGDLLFGETPELTEDWAHGLPPTRGQGFGTVVKPEAIDYTGLPLAGTTGALANRALIKALRSAGGRTISAPRQSDRVRQAIGQYMGDDFGYAEGLNAYLRTGKVPGHMSWSPKGFSPEEFPVDEVDEFLKSNRVPKGTTLYRGVYGGADPTQANPGFSSWTTDRDMAEEFAAAADEGVVVEFTTSKDIPGYMTGSEEGEVILPRWFKMPRQKSLDE